MVRTRQLYFRSSALACTLAGLLCLFITACNYQPLYGNTKPGLSSDKHTGIHIALVTTRTEQLVRNALLDELALSGIRADKIHDLALRVYKRRVPFALRSDESPTRFDVTLSVGYELRESGVKKTRVTGRNRARASYNVVASDYANIVSENAAAKRAAVLVARQITARLAVFFQAAAK